MVRITHPQIITLPVVERIERGADLTGWSNHKTHSIQPDHIAADITLGLPEKRRAATILDQGITHDHGMGMAADHHRFKETPCDHIPFQPHIRLACNRNAMIVIMDNIPDEDGF